MKFKKIYIENFQSIKEETFYFEENRFHHIKGKNNIGKSAVLKAIITLVKNVSSRVVKDYIRDYEESFFIESTDPDGNVIRLSRGKEDYYEWFIDGDSGRVDGTNGKVPEEITSYFNFYDDSEKTKEVVNIRPPRSKLLFVDTTFGENYYLLQKALGVEEFLAAIKLGDSKKRELKKDIGSLADRVQEETEEIKDLKDFNKDLKDLSPYIEAGDNHRERLEIMKGIFEKNEEVREKEEFLKDAMLDIDEEDLKRRANRVFTLGKIIELMEEIEEKEKEIARTEEKVRYFEEVKEKKERMEELEYNRQELARIEKAREERDKLETEIKEIEDRVESIGIEDIRRKKEFLEEAGAVIDKASEFMTLLEEKKEAERLYEEKDKEREEFMIENKFCPVVMSMKDKKCPFSGKPLEELLEESIGG